MNAHILIGASLPHLTIIRHITQYNGKAPLYKCNAGSGRAYTQGKM